MALKFRRGTTAQQSGSLAFGEPYVNTTLGTLLVGGPNGDIVLSTAGTGSTGTFGAISGSGLDITGDANIAGNLTLGGNITIGNATTDTVVINADLSSSIIPDTTNVFDIGSPTKIYSKIYGNIISGSVVEITSGSNPELRFNNKTTGIAFHIQNGDSGKFTIHNATTSHLAVTFESSSHHPNVLLYADLNVSQSILANRLVANTISGSFSGSVNGIGNVTDYSSSVASKFATLATTGSNTLQGNQTIIGTGTGFAAYISTSVNDGTLGLDTTANVNAAYFLKNGEKNFEVSYDTTNANGIFRLLPYDNSSYFQIGNPSNSANNNSDYVLISEATYGNVLIGPGLGNGTSYVAGATPLTDKVQVKGNLYVSGAIKADSFTGQIKATNGVVSGSSQVLDVLTSLNSYTSSLEAGIQMTGSTVSFLGNIVVYGTQSIINSENLAVSDNLIYLNNTSQVTNPDLGVVGNYNDGTYAHAGIFRDASDGGAWKVFEGYTLEPSGTIDTTGNGFTLADFKADVITATSFNGTINATNGVVSGSSQVIGILSSLNTYTGSNDTTNTTQNTRLTALEVSASTALSTNNTQATSITNLNSATASLMIETANLEAFSASALTRLSDLEGKDISITLTGDVTGTGTITNLANVSFATTIAANSVALGTDTTGDYVASLVAGTGVTITNNSGEGATPTVAIGQAVATSSSPTFAGLTINGAITATGDITAYYTSDKRHKNNIQIIPNALQKVSKLNGVTWEWNDDVHEVTKSTPKTGLIAQEVQEVLPEVVKEREDGFLSLDYSKMMGLLVEAIKEQQIQIHKLTLEVESLKSQKGL